MSPTMITIEWILPASMSWSSPPKVGCFFLPLNHCWPFWLSLVDRTEKMESWCFWVQAASTFLKSSDLKLTTLWESLRNSRERPCGKRAWWLHRPQLFGPFLPEPQLFKFSHLSQTFQQQHTGADMEQKNCTAEPSPDGRAVSKNKLSF